MLFQAFITGSFGLFSGVTQVFSSGENACCTGFMSGERHGQFQTFHLFSSALIIQPLPPPAPSILLANEWLAEILI